MVALLEAVTSYTFVAVSEWGRNLKGRMILEHKQLEITVGKYILYMLQQ